MRRKSSFIKLFRLWGTILLVAIGISIVAIDVIGAHRDFNSRADKMRSDYIDRQKQIIKQEVHRVVDMILYNKKQSEILTRKKIKSRVYEAYSIAQNIYEQNKTAKSDSEIQKIILDALRPIRFEQESGYYFATRLDGIEILFADRPEMEGLNLLDIQDTRGQFVIKDMIEIAEQSNEGFYEYHWTKPDSQGNDFKKISFIKLFEPYDWFIGTGLYVDDVENEIKADLLSTISRIRFGKEGYIFINRLNGDALVSNGKLFSGTKKLWQEFNKAPEKMKDIFKKEYDAAMTPEGDYIYYSHVKLTEPNKQSPKASFIYGIPDMQWLVGAGVYLDDVETDIALIQTELNRQITAKLLYLILIVLGMIALTFLFFNWLGRGFKHDFNVFVSFFKRATHSDEEIDREVIRFVELDQMAEYANKMLADRRRSEHKKNELEARLQRAEKMEAIGMLAGGVAHDLNNVLSGLVSYPDLLLMDLPNDSPLRKAVLTIQDSGKKAAAIVQDLLTLARRGVSVSEVMNLNDVVSDYLTSPEYQRLKTFYPDAQIDTDLEGDLLNVLGSSVHLSKALMNLVSNAVESLRNGGIVTISTRNVYVDRPIKGYDEVKEGDYVALTVEDNGIGIADEDLKNIFEPFYTKKMMGRSGTGLGMSVVWGTLKDHSGYIDVQSIEGKGSKFTLYLPITRRELYKDEPLSIAEYTGNGEKILVVDDVQQQGKIASDLLKRLGYSVEVVSSGEGAVEYMEKNSADLLILDMIMDPGIDGLDTYRKIIAKHPGQKAIIVSGFSESDRVKEAQKLGAGQYVTKPYTLGKIGLAVKAELSR